MTGPDFNVDAFLAGAHTARVATNGPTVRPTWYLWEGGVFWVLTGPWAKLLGHVREDPRVALTVDVCDTSTGMVKQVIAQGRVEVVAFDPERGYRKLSRYLGPDEASWDRRFRDYLHDEDGRLGTVWLRITPTTLRSADLSYVVP